MPDSGGARIGISLSHFRQTLLATVTLRHSAGRDGPMFSRRRASKRLARHWHTHPDTMPAAFRLTDLLPSLPRPERGLYHPTSFERAALLLTARALLPLAAVLGAGALMGLR